MNALPIRELPTLCFLLSFRRSIDSSELRRIREAARARLILATSGGIRCWGNEDTIRQTFGADLLSIEPVDMPTDLSRPDTLHLRSFVAEALCWALAKGKPLLPRSAYSGVFLIANPSAPEQKLLAPLVTAAGATAGQVADIMTTPTDDHPKAEQIRWAEALRLSLDQKDGRTWLLIKPDIWIWPPRARRDVDEFLEKRRADRFNSKHDILLSAWIQIILGTDERNADVTLRTFDGESSAGNPSFHLGTRTAFSRRRAS